MQPKKRPSPRRLPGGHVLTVKGQGPRRPVGMQAMGPALYAQIRLAVLQLGEATGS
jgi:enamine deaminase RidA (YjgF/YER057c/UK114 family)